MHRLLPAIAALALGTSLLGTADASAASGFYENGAEIQINASGKAKTYPSKIGVQGQPGVITDVSVGLRGLSHERPAELDLLLVAPSGTSTILMSDACGVLVPVVNATWTFSQLLGVPMTSGNGCPGNVHRPTNHYDGDVWPDAPAGPHVADLDRFVGEDPNGEWRLYIYDDSPVDGGRLARGWTLGIQTQVPAATLSATADPYPMAKVVDGSDTAIVTDVNVRLDGLYHERPEDLDVMLEGPRGDRVMVVSDACGARRIKDYNWIFDDEASVGIAPAPCLSGRFVTTDFGPDESLPSPAPSRPYYFNLSAFDWKSPNGQWRLWVGDDTRADAAGFMTYPWTLELSTREPAPTSLAANTIEVVEGETAKLTIRRTSSGGPLGPGAVDFATTAFSATEDADFKPFNTTISIAAEEETIEIPIPADEVAEGPETFAVTLDRPTADATLAPPATAIVTIRDRTPRPEPGVDPAGGPVGGGDPGPGPSGDEPGGGPAPDRTAPVISPLTLAPAKLRLRRATTLGFALSEASALSVEVLRGRRKVATLRRLVPAGVNRVRLTRRIGRRLLRPGRHRLRVTAVDAAGNRSLPRTRRLEVTR
jgi:subtilisin-like proprotein convertase family protein